MIRQNAQTWRSSVILKKKKRWITSIEIHLDSFLWEMLKNKDIFFPFIPWRIGSNHDRKGHFGENVIYSPSILCVVFFFPSSEVFHFRTKHCHMFLPSGSMSSECIKYQLTFTMRLALTEKTFSNNAFCYETPFFHAHTTVHMSPVYFQPSVVTEKKNKNKTSKQPFLKVENIQGTYSLIICCLLLLFNITHISVFCACCVTVHSS